MLKVPEKTATHQFLLDHSKYAYIAGTEGTRDNDGVVRGAKSPTTVRNVTQSGYLSYMADVHQITPETIKAFTLAEEQLVTGAIEVTCADLSERIGTAKKAGDDPEDLAAVLKIARPGGQLRVTMTAAQTVPNPKTGERHVRHGVVSVRVRTDSMIDDGAVKTSQETIAALMGG